MLPSNATLFISDLHLSGHHPALHDLFLQFLQGPAMQAKRLFILGDLFDAWLGNDINVSFQNNILNALRVLSLKGIPCFFMAGNRDFLINSTFLNQAQIKKLPDPYLIDLHGIPTLLTHGDRLCIQDVAYQRYRALAQNPVTRFIFLKLPKRLREQIGSRLRQKSQAYQQKQTSNTINILDVCQAEVERWFVKYKVKQMILGHVHRPNIHDHILPTGLTKRLVLGDWHTKASLIISTPNQNSLATFCPREGIKIKASYTLETVGDPLG